MESIKILLTETSFSNICKSGFIRYYSKEYGTSDVSLTKLDIMSLIKGETVTKNFGEKMEIKLNLSNEMAKEIVKRSPLFSDIYYEIN